MRKISLYFFGIVVIIGSYFVFGRVRISRLGAMQEMLEDLHKEEIRILEQVELLDNYEWIAYVTDNQQEYGAVLIKKIGGILYRADSSSRREISSQGPLVAIKPSMHGKEMVFVGTNDPNIRYISSGIENENFTKEQIRALTLEEILTKPESYKIQEVKDNHVLFIWEDTLEFRESMKNSYILGFDKEGELIVDRTSSMYGVYVDEDL